MACATLKRSLDWEELNQRPTKRRRCNPFGGAAAAAASAATSGGASYRSAAAAKYTHMECAKSTMEPAPSAFSNITYPKLTPEKMAQNIRNEIKRFRRRKQLQFSPNADRMQDSESSGSEIGPDSPRRPDTPPTGTTTRDKGLFTFKQVQLICERMLKEQEDYLREQYDTVLTNKLAEQYDAFVKFTYDQIQRRYEAAPSYLS